MAKHVIELNGQQYDALTGKPLQLKTAAVSKKSPVKATTKNQSQHLDGFSRRPSTMRSATATVSNKVHATPAKSQTLMRKVVAKPAPATKISAKATATRSTTLKQSPEPKVSTTKPGRAIRAGHIAQSSTISKFGKTPLTINTQELAVKPAPTSTTIKTESKATQAKSSKSSTSHQQTHVDPFKAAIDNATSHEQPRIAKTSLTHRVAKKLHVSPRLVTMSGTFMALLVIGSVFAYQNMPELAMRVAATRAGLNASLPAYQPAGFALSGPIKYDSGEVTVNYKSSTDERAFDVTQKNSSWNSETLLENYVATTNQPYQTFQANGRTIYIYEGNKATWVDGGVWFNIDGKTNLNSDQLLRIADSL